jgi:hypothetical protein
MANKENLVETIVVTKNAWAEHKKARRPILIRNNNFHNMSWVLKVERQAYNNEKMWKNLGIPNLRMQKVTADFPNSFVKCGIPKIYNPSIWLLGCDSKEEIKDTTPTYLSASLPMLCSWNVFTFACSNRTTRKCLPGKKDHYSRASPTSFRK